MWTYVGSTASGKNEGIHVGRWNADAGVVEDLRLAYACTQPSFQVTASLGSGMYLFSGHQPNETRAALSSFRIGGNGHLEVVNTIEVDDEPESFVQIALDRTHRVLVSVSYRSSKVRTFQVAPDGRLSQPVVEFTLHGSGPNAKRQEKSHSHGAVVSPENKFVLINDLGTDRIMIYRLDQATGSMEPNDPAFYQAKSGSGPRHTVFHPNGTIAYSINELNSTITTMSWDAEHGSLHTLDETPTTAPDVDVATNRAGEVALDTSGRFLYACNRGGVEELLVYNVSSEGKLNFAGRIPLDGKEARHFAISPDGKWLVVAEQFSNIVSVYQRDPASGALKPSGSRYPVSNPSCISFA